MFTTCLESGVVLRPDNHGAESFQLMDIQQLTDRLASGQFKTNCALVIIDFLIRHGAITAESEKDYISSEPALHLAGICRNYYSYFLT